MVFLLGLSFFVGGLQRKEQYFNSTSGKTLGNCLLFAVFALMIPTVFGRSEMNLQASNDLSRAISIILILIYLAQLLFIHKSHTDVWIAPSLKVAKINQTEKQQGDTFKALAIVGGSATAIAGLEAGIWIESDELESPQLSLGGSLLALILATALLGAHTEFTTSNLSGLIHDTQISSVFIGLVLFPVFSLDPSCLSSADKDQQYININSILPRCIQITFLIIPILTLAGWALGSDGFSLVFDYFEIVLLFGSVYVTYGVIAKGRSDWYVFVV
jgi:Ca2+:H+ antiporter